jgi:hypothetical protein
MRVYMVSSNSGSRLVRAGHRAQALQFVASQEYSIRVASQDDLIKCLAEGKAVETAVSPDQIKLDLDGGSNEATQAIPELA